MTRCYCIDCHPEQTAPESYKFSEEFRRACEARMVLRMDLVGRAEYLAGVSEARGKEAAEQLAEDINHERSSQISTEKT